MSEVQCNAAASHDPDAMPLTLADFKRMKRTPQVKVIHRVRRTLSHFLGVLRDGSKVLRFPISLPAPISP